MKNALVVGGTNGLGYEIAKILAIKGYEVAVAGRVKRDESLKYFPLSMSTMRGACPVSEQLDRIVEAWPCDLLVYAAGFYQEGLISNLSDAAINDMVLVGVAAPAMLVKRYASKRGLEGFIAVTSTSQWTPRRLEPVYTAAKAGLGMLARSISEDGCIDRVLVAGPAGMKTSFWDGTDKDTVDMLDPKWVAENILSAYLDEGYRYKFIKIHRCPARVELVEALASSPFQR